MSYGQLQAIAYIIEIIYILFRMRKTKKVQIITSILIEIISITIFARLFWVISNIQYFKEGVYGIDDIFKLQLGNFKIVGVLIGALIGMLILCKIYKKDSKLIINTVIESLFLAAGYTKLVCTIVGCCRGKETTLPWAVSYPKYDEYNLHPTTLYEVIVWWTGFILLHILKKYIKKDSTRISLVILFYILIRMFILEGLYSGTPFMGNFTARIVYIIIILICLAVLGINYYKNKKSET